MSAAPFSHLLEPLAVGPVTLPHRIVSTAHPANADKPVGLHVGLCGKDGKVRRFASVVVSTSGPRGCEFSERELPRTIVADIDDGQ